MSVLTDVLKKKDHQVDEIPETELPDEGDLEEVGRSEDSPADTDVHELSVDETGPEVVADAIAELEATDPNETANVAPALVLEDTVAGTEDEFTSTAVGSYDLKQAFAETQAMETQPESRPTAELFIETENRHETEASAEQAVAAPAASPDTARQHRLVLVGVVIAAILAAVAYFYFVVLSPNPALAPADSFAPADWPAEPDALATAPIERSPEPLVGDEVQAKPAPATPTASTNQPERSAPVAARSAPAPAIDDRIEENPVRVSSGIRINRQRRDNPVFTGLSRAYDAYVAGDAASAAEYYRDVIGIEPTNRDALLGLASLAQSDGRIEEARFYFTSLLELNPKDGVAAAGLMSLQQQADHVADESALKSMLREQPEAAHLHFALGMRYVAQGRWPDAQTAFFDAVRFTPEHPDYNFNLAVSLDRLGKTSSAAIYYKRAIDNATGRQGFDLAQAQSRFDALNGR